MVNYCPLRPLGPRNTEARSSNKSCIANDEGEPDSYIIREGCIGIFIIHDVKPRRLGRGCKPFLLILTARRGRSLKRASSPN